MSIQNPFYPLDCELSISESKIAKRINLKVKAPNKVILIFPHGSSVKKALSFAESHYDWVAKQLTKVKIKAENKIAHITPENNFHTKYHQFTFNPHERTDAFVRVLHQVTALHYPKTWLTDSPEMQHLIQIALRETYRIEAKSYLPTRLKGLAQKHGFIYNKVSIRDTKGRWGSCSGAKNISLSLSLMNLPFHLIDYILLHELCHTVEMNHSERFHRLLNKACDGKSKELNHEVKQYSPL